MPDFNIYCDESCHLENDGIEVMVLGALSCPTEYSRQASEEIRAMKALHGFKSSSELKWTKVQSKYIDLYSQLVDYFCKNPQLRYRGIIVPHKSQLRHEDFGQDHEEWYYKMYYVALEFLLTDNDHFYIYLDQQNTHSYAKAKILHRVLARSINDFEHEHVCRVQPIRSHGVELMQITDVLTGAIGYANRDEPELVSESKKALIALISRSSGVKLTESTAYSKRKFNLLRWQAREVGE